jgi:hypothetical protein
MTSAEMSSRLANSRAAVRQAKDALRATERTYDDDRCFGEGNLNLITKIRAGERRVAEARANLRKVDPTSVE